MNQLVRVLVRSKIYILLLFPVFMAEIVFLRDPRGCFVSSHLERSRELSSLLGEKEPHMFQPVRFKGEDGNSIVGYVSQGGPCGISAEDWSIPLRAFSGDGQSYEVLENGKKVYRAESREDATRWMDERIVEKGY